MRRRLNLTSAETEIVDTIVGWDAKLLERPPRIEITGETEPRITPYLPQTPEGHRLIIQMDKKAAKQLCNQLRDLI